MVVAYGWSCLLDAKSFVNADHFIVELLVNSGGEIAIWKYDDYTVSCRNDPEMVAQGIYLINCWKSCFGFCYFGSKLVKRNQCSGSC